MNPHIKLATVTQSEISPAEWQARVDLAATYRLTAHYGWGDVIYNHSSMRVPGEERKFLIKRHELLYTEVTPSNLVKVSMDDNLDESAGVNRPGFTLHGGVLSARPDITAPSTCIPRSAWRSPDCGTVCACYRSRRCVFTIASAITITKASPRISASVPASTRRWARTAR